MLRTAILLCVCGLVCLGREPMPQLPKPDYERLDSDPEWLAYAAQFHGHLGPWATAGTRLGMAGVREVGATGYFDYPASRSSCASAIGAMHPTPPLPH